MKKNINIFLRNVKNGLENLKDPNSFIDYSDIMLDVYKNITEYNPSRKCNFWLIFDDMIADMLSNNKLNAIVTELFIRDIKLNVSHVFITQSYFAVPKNIRLNSKLYFLWNFLTNGSFN